MLSSPPLSLSVALTLRCLELEVPSPDFRLLVLWAAPDECNIPTKDLLKLEHLAFRELLSCIPNHLPSRVSLTIRWELIAYLTILSSTNQLALTTYLGANRAMRERLITAFGNSPTHPFSPSIPARVSSNSPSSGRPIAPKKLPSPQSHSLSATLSERLSNLRLKATQSRI